MNRIILIGNGFDLAHGMKTSYSNFLDDLWDTTVKEIEKASSQIGVAFQNKFIQVHGTKLIGHNYNDLVRNISRNFNDKALMRSKVVNKTYCESLT